MDMVKVHPTFIQYEENDVGSPRLKRAPLPLTEAHIVLVVRRDFLPPHGERALECKVFLTSFDGDFLFSCNDQSIELVAILVISVRLRLDGVIFGSMHKVEWVSIPSNC